MRHLITGLAALVLLTTCTDAGTSPNPPGNDGSTSPPPPVPQLAPSDVAGNYRATTFTTQEAGTTTDWLAAGATLDLVLQIPAVTTGRLFMPDAAEDGSDFDEDMAGTWTLRADTVDVEQGSDTFVRDVPFVYAAGRLTGERTFSGVLVRVVLTKQ